MILYITYIISYCTDADQGDQNEREQEISYYNIIIYNIIISISYCTDADQIIVQMQIIHNVLAHTDSVCYSGVCLVQYGVVCLKKILCIEKILCIRQCML